MWLTYSEARALMASARDPDRGKPLQNNTRLYERADSDGTVFYAVQLHNTDIVEIRPRGVYRVRTGGWDTVTTMSRMSEYAPNFYRRTLMGKRDERTIRTRPRASDPEPPYPRMEVERPFRANDPGPRPEKPAQGCMAGRRSVLGIVERTHVRANDLTGRERVALDSYRAPKPQPTAARDVLAYIGFVTHELECDLLGLWVERASVKVTNWIDVPYRYGARDAKQCPHCAAYDRVLRAWEVRMNGSYGRGSNSGWAGYTAALERFGSFEAWQAAYRDELRRVREARRIWRAWDTRNSIPWDGDGIDIASDGYPLWREVRAVRRWHHELKMREIRARRAAEAAERERRQIERFKARVRRQRGDRFEVIASNVATTLAQIAGDLSQPTNNELESCDV